MTTRSITTIEVGEQTVRHAVDHPDDRASFILEGEISFAYLIGTLDELDEFAGRISRAVTARRGELMEATMIPIPFSVPVQFAATHETDPAA